MVLSVEKIQLCCARRCKSFSEAFQEARISSTTMQRIRAGKDINPKVAGKLAAALGCDPAELLEYES